MKKLIIMLLISSTSGAYAQQKIDFSGNYKVNEEKVNWGPAPKYILPRYIKVQQLKDKIIITKTTLNEELEEQKPTVDTIAFDGGLAARAIANGGKITQSIKWIDEKSFLLTRNVFNTDGNLSGAAKETWILEDGGKTLIINREVAGKNNFTIKGYFDNNK